CRRRRPCSCGRPPRARGRSGRQGAARRRGRRVRGNLADRPNGRSRPWRGRSWAPSPGIRDPPQASRVRWGREGGRPGSASWLAACPAIEQNPTMDLRIETELEEDGRWIAEVPQLPGVLVYGATAEEAATNAEALALRVLAERLE